VDKTEIKISEEKRYQRYKPEVRQGYWKHIKTLAGATQDIETYRWEDYITPTRQATQRERIRFADWIITPEIAQYRSKIRKKYSLTGYNHYKYNLQQLCLIAYSTANNRPIDSIVLEVSTDSLSINTCRLVIEDNRGIPIRANTLEPYSNKELEGHISGHLRQWISAGGFERYIIGGTSFWVDLWEITLTEKNPVLEWLVPEARPGEVSQPPQTTEAGTDQYTKSNQGEEEHRPQHSFVSYHQDTTRPKILKNKNQLNNNSSMPMEMPMMMVRTINIKLPK
jgi:hypothetical protein